MSDETQTSPPGSKTPTEPATPPTSTPKMVPESDLVAVKKGAEKKEAELLSQIAEANRIKDEKHNLYLQTLAAKEQLEEQAKEGATLKDKVAELEGTLNATESSRKQLEEELLGIKRTSLAKSYNVSEESLKDKSASELKNLEDALSLVGNSNKKPANFDQGPGGISPPSTGSKLDELKEELKLAKEMAVRRASGDTDYKY